MSEKIKPDVISGLIEVAMHKGIDWEKYKLVTVGGTAIVKLFTNGKRWHCFFAGPCDRDYEMTSAEFSAMWLWLTVERLQQECA